MSNERKLIASFEGPGSFDDARDLRDVLRSKGQTVFMEREGAVYKVVQPVELEENADGATVLVMKQAKKPKGKPFKAAARKLPKK